MKSITFLIILILVGVKSGFSQNYSTNDTLKIYKMIVKHLRKSHSNYRIYPQTKKTAYNNFNFKDPTGVDTSSTKIWKKKEWKSFLNNIDTAKAKNYLLESNGKLWFKNLKSNKTELVVFAPILIANKNDKALSIIQIFNGDSGSRVALYLEKENNSWKIKDIQTFAYLD